MRRLRKQRGPHALRTYAKTPGDPPPSWEDAPSAVVLEVREALLTEQDRLCCYCMARIHGGAMKVEHFLPQSAYPELVLTWSNLFGACLGDHRTQTRDTATTPARHRQTCDTHKGNTECSVEPTRVIDTDFRYLATGELRHREGEIQAQIGEVPPGSRGVLNLNAEHLRQLRRSAWLTQMDRMRTMLPSKGHWTESMLLACRQEVLTSKRPFYPVELALVDLRIARSRRRT